MPVLLQLIALLQFFLPGFLFLRLLKLRRNLLRTLLLSFSLSGLFNYAVVLLLYPWGLFTQGSVLALFLAEVILLYFTENQLARSAISLSAVDDFFLPMAKTEQRFSRFFFGLAVVVLGIQAFAALRGFGQIFYSWDSVLSWNQWAAGWFSGTIGTQRTLGYPQLIPCGWAMAYQIIGEPLNFIPKGTTLLCPLFVSLMLFDLAFTLNRPALFAAVALNAWFTRNIDPSAAGAEADFVITFYIFAVFYLLFLARKTDKTSNLLLAALTAIAAGCAKQSGLVVLLLFPVLVHAFGLLHGREFFRKTVLYVLLAILFAAPYYLYFAVRSSQGADRGIYTHVTHDIYGERNRGQLLTAASKQFFCKLQLGMNSGVPTPKRANVNFNGGVLNGIIQFYGWQLWPALAVLILNILCLHALKRIPFWRGAVWWVTLPYLLVWSLLFCYDLRNLMPFLPLFAAGLSLGFLNLTEQKWFRCLLLFLFLLLLASILFIPGSRIRKYHDSQRMRIGDVRLNHALLPYLKQPGLIATDYQFLNHLPEVGKKLFFVEYSLPDSGKDHEKALRDPAVRWLLIPRYASKELKQDVKTRLKNQEIRLIFSVYNYTLYRKTGDR